MLCPGIVSHAKPFSLQLDNAIVPTFVSKSLPLPSSVRQYCSLGYSVMESLWCVTGWYGYSLFKTVLSCPCQRCEHNCRQDKTGVQLWQISNCLHTANTDKTRQSCLVRASNFQVFSSLLYIWHWAVANWKLGRDETKLSCLVASSVHTIDYGQDKTELSVSAVLTSY